jgi:hypothetical protein
MHLGIREECLLFLSPLKKTELLLLLLLLFTAIWFALGGSSPTLVKTKTIKQHYTVVQHNTIKRKQHNTIKRKHKIIRTYYNKHTIIHTKNNKIHTRYNKIKRGI